MADIEPKSLSWFGFGSSPFVYIQHAVLRASIQVTFTHKKCWIASNDLKSQVCKTSSFSSVCLIKFIKHHLLLKYVSETWVFIQ